VGYDAVDGGRVHDVSNNHGASETPETARLTTHSRALTFNKGAACCNTWVRNLVYDLGGGGYRGGGVR
jgi:hypothetical protein